jgi:hypothetical protein
LTRVQGDLRIAAPEAFVTLEGGDTMKKRLAGLAVAVAAVAAVALVVLWPASAQTAGKIADHALIDQTGGDIYVQCRTTNSRAFDVHAALRAFGGDVTVRVVFQDGDFVEYHVAQNDTLSFSQAAGTTDGVDNRIRIRKSGGAGSIVGWVSAGRLDNSGAFLSCRTKSA